MNDFYFLVVYFSLCIFQTPWSCDAFTQLRNLPWLQRGQGIASFVTLSPGRGWNFLPSSPPASSVSYFTSWFSKIVQKQFLRVWERWGPMGAALKTSQTACSEPCLEHLHWSPSRLRALPISPGWGVASPETLSRPLNIWLLGLCLLSLPPSPLNHCLCRKQTLKLKLKLLWSLKALYNPTNLELSDTQW